jgi:DNA-binding transcriptional LysR family regulator
MDRLEAMAMLVAVTDEGSFSAASRLLKVPLPTLSRKISELEKQLGSRLLTRTTRKLTLTDVGIAFVAASRRILEQMEEAENQATGEYIAPKGELVITAPIMFGRLHVIPVVAEFLAAFPQINIRLVLSDKNVDLIDHHVDTAIRIGRLPDSSMVATGIGQMRTVTCASAALLATKGRPQTPYDLNLFPSIIVDTPMPNASWSFKMPESNTKIDMPILPRLTVTTPEAAVEAAILGVGVVRLLHYQVFNAINRQELEVILENYELDKAPVHLVHVSRGMMPLKMRLFIDFAAPRLKLALSKIAKSTIT